MKERNIKEYIVSIDDIIEKFEMKGRMKQWEATEIDGEPAILIHLVQDKEPSDVIEENGFEVHTVEMEGDADEGQFCYSKVVGTTFREEENPLPWDDFKVGHRLNLLREPDNKFDKNAVKVIWYNHLEKTDVFIGYIPKGTATTLANIMDDGQLYLYAKISDLTGGTEGKEQRGINIEVRYNKIKNCKHPNRRIEDHDGYDYFVCPDCGNADRIDPHDRGDDPGEEH